MYGRDYAGKTLHFEPSGGLKNASLVMLDQETDTYWSLMKGKALAGELKGETLKELPVGEKLPWKVWRDRHPTTKILSVNGKENRRNKFGEYFKNAKGFRGITAKDQRLETKAPIFAFHHNNKSFAIRHADADGGKTFSLPDGGEIFLFRTASDDIMRSTAAFVSANGFTKKEGQWTENSTELVFDQSTRTFANNAVKRIGGFDTYWYNWSLNNPDTEVYMPEAEGSGKKH